MPFNTYNGSFNNNGGNQNNGGGNFNAGNNGGNPNATDKHYKFPKIYGDDSYVSTELWISQQGGAKAIVRVYTGVKNPGTGKITFEEGKPSTLPAVYLGIDEVSALVNLKNANPKELNVSHTRGTRTISIIGSEAGVKLTIAEDGKGNPRSIMFRQYFGFNGGWTSFIDICQKIYDKMIVSKVPDDFGAAMGEATATPEASSSAEMESPF